MGKVPEHVDKVELQTKSSYNIDWQRTKKNLPSFVVFTA